MIYQIGIYKPWKSTRYYGHAEVRYYNKYGSLVGNERPFI